MMEGGQVRGRHLSDNGEGREGHQGRSRDLSGEDGEKGIKMKIKRTKSGRQEIVKSDGSQNGNSSQSRSVRQIGCSKGKAGQQEEEPGERGSRQEGQGRG